MKLFVAAKALIVNNGKVLLLREAAYDEGTNKGKWGVPGGRIHDDEAILEGLDREVMEESGLIVKSGAVIGTIENFPVIKGEKCHIIRLYYSCEYQGGEVALSNEHDQFGWFNLNEIIDVDVVNGEIDLVKKVLIDNV